MELMILLITLGIIVLCLFIRGIVHDVRRNKSANSIRPHEPPLECPICGYAKWATIPQIDSHGIRLICQDCSRKTHEAIRKKEAERQRDIQQNPREPRYIPLENGGYAIVENRDYDLISRYSWYKDKDGYVVTMGYWSMHKVSMHRLVKGLKYVKGHHVHHKNHDRADNRRSNLMRTSAKRHGKMHKRTS